MALAKVLGPLRQYAPKIAAPKGKGSPTKLDLDKAKAKITAPTATADTPALFYKSREALIDAPMEKMTADRWLNYLNAKGIRKSELLDTSLGPFFTVARHKNLYKN